VDTREAVRRWIDAWSQAWPRGDAAPLEAVYADGAAFRSEPFRELQAPLEYAEWAFSEQDAAECRFGEPIVDRDRAAVEYWGVVSFEGRDETIFGVAVLRFGADGKVVEQRDCWNSREGRHEAPPGWGR
jgi:hypothetical protein